MIIAQENVAVNSEKIEAYFLEKGKVKAYLSGTNGDFYTLVIDEEWNYDEAFDFDNAQVLKQAGVDNDEARGFCTIKTRPQRIFADFLKEIGRVSYLDFDEFVKDKTWQYAKETLEKFGYDGATC